MTQDMTFTLTIEAQDMVVHYWLQPFAAADYAHFEFISPHEPKRRIPVSETGYRSHFAPSCEVAEYPSVEEYASTVALQLMRGCSRPPDDYEEDEEEEPEQLALF